MLHSLNCKPCLGVAFINYNQINNSNPNCFVLLYCTCNSSVNFLYDQRKYSNVKLSRKFVPAQLIFFMTSMRQHPLYPNRKSLRASPGLNKIPGSVWIPPSIKQLDTGMELIQAVLSTCCSTNPRGSAIFFAIIFVIYLEAGI